MADPTDPKIIAAGAAGVVGAAYVKDLVDGDDGADADSSPFGGDDLGGLDDGGLGDVGDLGVADLDDGGSFAEDMADYQADQQYFETMSEMSEMQHQTNMEIIDNMDGTDDYYYEEVPDTDW